MAGTKVGTESGETAIEDVRLGDRVSSGNDACASDHIGSDDRTFAFEMPNPDAPDDILHFSMVRPSTWLTTLSWNAEARAWIAFPEMEIAGWSELVAVDAAPREVAGKGCLVVMTVNHRAKETLRLGLADREEPLELTPQHPLFVEGKGWTAASRLRLGDVLRADRGSVQVSTIERRLDHPRVYNLEVEREHTYRVTDAQIWAHNSYGGAAEGAASQAINAPRLANQLVHAEASSAFTAAGELSAEAIQGAKQIIAPGQLGNPAIPAGFGKFTTESFASPAGPFQVHFYMNPSNGAVHYGLDFKAIFNGGVQPFRAFSGSAP